MATELYTRLTYDEYKKFEEQLRDWESLETTHESAGREFYHKSIRLRLGDLILEVHGPIVKP